MCPQSTSADGRDVPSAFFTQRGLSIARWLCLLGSMLTPTTAVLSQQLPTRQVLKENCSNFKLDYILWGVGEAGFPAPPSSH